MYFGDVTMYVSTSQAFFNTSHLKCMNHSPNGTLPVWCLPFGTHYVLTYVQKYIFIITYILCNRDEYFYLDINWGSSTQAHVYRNALQHTQKLILVLEHVKNYR